MSVARPAPAVAVWTRERIRALRRALEENAETFGAAVGRSGRAVEDWEQGRYAAPVRVQRLLTERARVYLKAKAAREAAAARAGGDI